MTGAAVDAFGIGARERVGERHAEDVAELGDFFRYEGKADGQSVAKAKLSAADHEIDREEGKGDPRDSPAVMGVVAEDEHGYRLARK